MEQGALLRALRREVEAGGCPQGLRLVLGRGLELLCPGGGGPGVQSTAGATGTDPRVQSTAGATGAKPGPGVQSTAGTSGTDPGVQSTAGAPGTDPRVQSTAGAPGAEPGPGVQGTAGAPGPSVQETEGNPGAEPGPRVQSTAGAPGAEPGPGVQSTAGTPGVQSTAGTPGAEPGPGVESTAGAPGAEPCPGVQSTAGAPGAGPGPRVQSTAGAPGAEPGPGVQSTAGGPGAEPGPGVQSTAGAPGAGPGPEVQSTAEAEPGMEVQGVPGSGIDGVILGSESSPKVLKVPVPGVAPGSEEVLSSGGALGSGQTPGSGESPGSGEALRSVNLLVSGWPTVPDALPQPTHTLESGMDMASEECTQDGVVPGPMNASLLGSAVGLQGSYKPTGALEPGNGPASAALPWPGAGMEAALHKCAIAPHGPESMGALEPVNGPASAAIPGEGLEAALHRCAIVPMVAPESTSVQDPTNIQGILGALKSQAIPGWEATPLILDVQESKALPEPRGVQGQKDYPVTASLDLCADLAQALCLHATPKEGSDEDRPSDPGVPKRAKTAGSVLVDLLRTLQRGEAKRVGTPLVNQGEPAPWQLPNSLVAPMYVFARTHCEIRPWTDQDSRAEAEDVLASLLQASGCGSIAELLRGHEEGEHGVLGNVLKLLKPHLKKDTWKQNPATKHVFSSTLLQVTRPWLCGYLDHVLPPSLLISDDYRTENKILGVTCLHHIILNVPAAELLQFNRAQVVYHALYNHLYTPEAKLIQVVLPCLLDLLPVMERSPQATREPVQRNRHTNEVLQLILTHMEMEDKILLRRVYAKHLPTFVERLGIGIARHLKRLERVLVGYLEVYDGPEEAARLSMLATLKCTIKYAWPRMPSRLGMLLKMLLQLMYDVATDTSLTPGPVKSALLQGVSECLVLLDRCSQRQVKTLLEGVSRTCRNQQVLDCLQKVQEDT